MHNVAGIEYVAGLDKRAWTVRAAVTGPLYQTRNDPGFPIKSGSSLNKTFTRWQGRRVIFAADATSPQLDKDFGHNLHSIQLLPFQRHLP
jgi:hypothetical protein